MDLKELRAEPSARHFHATVAFGANLFVLGGRGGRSSPVPSSVVERFNVASTAWQEPRQLRDQPLPECWDHMAVTSDEERAYFFGGYVGRSGSQVLSNALYALDLSSLHCSEIEANNEESSSPGPRSNSGMVFHQRQVVTYGGSTGGRKTSDELFVFDLDSSES